MKKIMIGCAIASLVFGIYLIFTGVNMAVKQREAAAETFDVESALFDYEKMNGLSRQYNQLIEVIYAKNNTNLAKIDVLFQREQCMDVVEEYNSISTDLNPEILIANDLPTKLDAKNC